METMLRFSVGKGGINLYEDVVKVQEFLNGVPFQDGGPIHKLPVTGIFTKATEQALNTYFYDFVILGSTGDDKEKGDILLPGKIDLAALALAPGRLPPSSYLQYRQRTGKPK